MKFPARMIIALTPFQRQGLEEIAKRRHETDADELVSVVLSRGIVEMLTEAGAATTSLSPREVGEHLAKSKRGHGQSPEGGSSSISSQGSVRPFPAPSVMYQRRRKKMLAELGYLPDGRELAADEAPASDQVENYVGAALPEKLRVRLQEYLDDHRGTDLETAIVNLLQRGLDRTESVPRAGPKTTRASRMVALAERLYARAQRRGAR